MQPSDNQLARLQSQFAAIDTMPAELRQCVHEFGYAIVHHFIAAGIREPNMIRHLVKTCWDGPRSICQRKRGAHEKIDWLLASSGSSLTAEALFRALYANGMVLVPIEPMQVAVDASLAEVSGFNQRVTKIEKHRLRLRAAMRATVNKLYPGLL
jgi:hypothetical protein